MLQAEETKSGRLSIAYFFIFLVIKCQFPGYLTNGAGFENGKKIHNRRSEDFRFAQTRTIGYLTLLRSCILKFKGEFVAAFLFETILIVHR